MEPVERGEGHGWRREWGEGGNRASFHSHSYPSRMDATVERRNHLPLVEYQVHRGGGGGASGMAAERHQGAATGMSFGDKIRVGFLPALNIFGHARWQKGHKMAKNGQKGHQMA